MAEHDMKSHTFYQANMTDKCRFTVRTVKKNMY